eukprot:2149823-Heterocapsa_arctica.AAC.1
MPPAASGAHQHVIRSGMPGRPGRQSEAKFMMTPETGMKFPDVAGIDEAKKVLTETVDFLKAPERVVK